MTFFEIVVSLLLLASVVSLLGACAKIEWLQEEVRQYEARERAGAGTSE